MLTSSIYTGIGMAQIPQQQQRLEVYYDREGPRKVYSRQLDEQSHPACENAVVRFFRDLVSRDFVLPVDIAEQYKHRKIQKCSFVCAYKGRSLKVQTGRKIYWTASNPYPFADMHVPYRLWEDGVQADLYVQLCNEMTVVMLTHMQRAFDCQVEYPGRNPYKDNEPFFVVPLRKTYTFFECGGMWYPKDVDLNIGQMIVDLAW